MKNKVVKEIFVLTTRVWCWQSSELCEVAHIEVTWSTD